MGLGHFGKRRERGGISLGRLQAAATAVRRTIAGDVCVRGEEA